MVYTQTEDHLEQSLIPLQDPEKITTKPIFEKIKPFNVSKGYKIGEIKTYHHNYEFSMEIFHKANSQGRILQGKLTES